MKKLLIVSIILGILLLSLIGFSSAWTYSQVDNTHPPAFCNATISGSDTILCENGRQVGTYCVGANAKWYTTISHVGDRFYITKEATAWPTCTETGCTGTGLTTASDGKNYVTTSTGFYAKYILTAWDYDSVSGNWCWVSQPGGYFGAGALGSWQNIICYDDTDCAAGYICDKSGAANTWACVNNPCYNFDKTYDGNLTSYYQYQTGCATKFLYATYVIPSGLFSGQVSAKMKPGSTGTLNTYTFDIPTACFNVGDNKMYMKYSVLDFTGGSWNVWCKVAGGTWTQITGTPALSGNVVGAQLYEEAMKWNTGCTCPAGYTLHPELNQCWKNPPI